MNKKLIKKIGKTIGTIALINQLSMPVFQTIGFNTTINDYKPNNSAKKELKMNPIETNKNFNALDYLNLAGYYTHHNIKKGEVCRHNANSTFDIYKELIKKDKRKDLEDKIRLCGGLNYKSGHIWIEYKLPNSNIWHNYETTRGINEKNLKDIKKYSRLGINEKLNFNEKDLESIRGTKIFYPTLTSLKGFGILEYIYLFLKK